MRTTLEIDDTLLAYAKGHAKHKHTTVGKVISDLALQALQGYPSTEPIKIVYRNGFPQIQRPPGSQVVITPEFIQHLLNETE